MTDPKITAAKMALKAILTLGSLALSFVAGQVGSSAQNDFIRKVVAEEIKRQLNK